MLGLTGFFAGVTYPSRDLIVRAATPPGAAGRVYGFVYSGLDVGSLATPVFYGWLMDRGFPQGVFFGVFGFTVLAIFTVLQLPGRRPAPLMPRT
jgi:MFS family permease